MGDGLDELDLAGMLSALKMPGMGGELIARVQRERLDLPVIVVTAFSAIRPAATRSGASMCGRRRP